MRWLALCVLLAGCGRATWSDALRDASDTPDGIAHAELRFIAAADAAGALSEAEALLAKAPEGSALADRALLLALEASRATGELDRPLPWLAHVTATTHDALLAEHFASELDRYWGRLDGGPATDGMQAVDALRARAGDAWEPARAEAALQRLTLMRQAASKLDGVAADAGIVTAWRVSAPWGKNAELDFDRALGPETRALGERETTGAGWDLTPIATTRATFSDGEVTFFDLAQVGGVGFAEARGELPEGRLRVRLETNRVARVYLDGREIVARTSRDEPWSTTMVVDRAAGARLTVKLASPDGTGFFRLRLTPVTSTGALPSLAGPVPVGDAAAAVRALALLGVQIGRPFVDPAGAHATLARLGALRTHPAVELIAARLARIDARVPAATQRVEARAHLEAALARWPKNAVATRALARLEKEEQRPDRALALLGSLDGDARTLLERLEIERDRGWEADALATVQALRARPGLMTSSPRVLQEAIETERTFGRLDAAARDLATLAVPALNLTLVHSAEQAVDAGQLGVAADVYLRAFALAPERHVLLRSAVAALRADGGAAALTRALALVDAFLADRPDDGWALAERARITLQAGDRAGALRQLEVLLARHPDFVPVELLVAALEGRAPALDEVEDGTSVVRAYREDPKSAAYASFPVVSILERTHIDVAQDGTTIEVQHRIRLVQSRAGADALGDFRPPDGARLLVARTLKADGRVLYPERTAGKTELSFPELRTGDAVETAWVAHSRVSPSEGGYLTGVSFAGYATPTWKQDVQVSVAAGLALSATRFGGAPEAVVSDGGQGRRTWSWQRTNLVAMPREPLAVGARSFFPFADLRVVRAAEDDASAAWKAIAEAFAARLERVLAPGPRLLAKAKALRDARGAFAWVKTELEDTEQLNLFETPVETAIVAGKGHRALALTALMRADGQPAEVWLCAPERDGPPEDRDAPSPNANRFFYPLVVARDVFLDPSRPWMPWNALPAELLGARCLVPEHVTTGAPLFAEVPAADPDQPPAFETHVDISVASSGDATVVVHGLARGVPAVPLRLLWSSVDDEKKRALWEQWASSMALGAHLDSFVVEDADDAEKPMRWTLALTFPGWARSDGDVLEIGKPLSPMAAADFASMPELSQLVVLGQRVTPLRVPSHRERLLIDVHVPSGFMFAEAELPPAFEGTFGPNRLQQTRRVTRDGLHVERTFSFLPGRVEPADYARFKALVDGAERAMSAPLRAVHAR